MASRIVVFGATGYTGRLVTEALVGRGVRPVLAGRNAESLAKLAAELGGEFETRTADVDRPETVRDLVQGGDVLVSTVGPFLRYGTPAVEAAIHAGAHYIDSTGEPPFIRRIFEEWGPRAATAGCGLLTSFGYDWVPGNLAGALALEQAGERATKISVGYFMSGGGSMRNAMSGGTAASAAGVMLERGYAYRDGRIQTERAASRVRSFAWGEKSLTAMSMGSSEHFALPAIYPQLRDVDAYLGWFGPASHAMRAVSLATEVPGVRAGIGAVVNRFVKGSTGGPDAEASDASGQVLARVLMDGPNGYTFTGDVMAWGAAHAASHGLEATGALGPVEAYGLETLRAGCAELGLKQRDDL